MGRTGVGKSSLINAIINKLDAKEGKELKGATRDIAKYSIEIIDVQYNIWDSSGLQDHGRTDNEILDNITTQLEQDCTHIHLLVYCLRMDTDRIESNDELAIKRLTDCFGPEIWELSVIALTNANKVFPPPDKDTDELAPIYFNERLKQYEDEIIKILRKCRMDEHKASEIAVIPIGYNTPTRQIPNPNTLPDRENWFDRFWITCAEKMTETAPVSLMSISDRPKLKVENNQPRDSGDQEVINCLLSVAWFNGLIDLIFLYHVNLYFSIKEYQIRQINYFPLAASRHYLVWVFW